MEEARVRHLLTFIFTLLFTCMFLGLTVVGILDYGKSNATYDDFVYREFTVDYCKRIEDSDLGIINSLNFIYVREEEKPLKISNLLSTRALVEKLDGLEAGDTIYCYAKEQSDSYEVGELGTDSTPFFSLADYNATYRKNGIGTAVFMPIIAAVLCVFSVKSFLSYRRAKMEEAQSND